MRSMVPALLLALAGCGDGDFVVDGGGLDAARVDSAVVADADADAAPAPPDARVTRELAVEACQDLGPLPLPSAVTIGRDGGEGGLLGGRYLWTFGDTFTTASNAIDGSHVLSATSGWASLDAPMALVEPVGGDGIPAQLIPYTAAEIAANQADPGHGIALWPGAVLDAGGGEAVVVFQRVQRMGGSSFAVLSVGTARIGVDATVATRAAGELFASPEPLFVPVTAVDGHVYAFACELVGFLGRECRMARAPAAQADLRAAYQFFDGDLWQDDPAAAAVVIDRAGNRPTLSANPWLGRYLAVNAPVVSGTVLLRTADRVEGPWSAAVEVPADGTCILPAVGDGAYGYIVVEHPELASPDGRQIVVSYSRHVGPGLFHFEVRLARITLR